MTERPVDRLLEVMASLRDPDGGCPWDVEQDFRSIAPYTIEEAYEVADAIARGDMADLRDELGDLLLQVVFHARMAEEAGHFDFNAVADSISDKMVKRHPHVFGDATVEDADAQTAAWEAQKEAERRAAGQTSALDGVTRGLPALMRAVKLQKRAARVGFDWDDPADVVAKVEEELCEFRDAARDGSAGDRHEEMGDLLFAVANLARKHAIDPEDALRDANLKFERRFRRVEDLLAEDGRSPAQSDLAGMARLWDRAKAGE